MSKKKVVFDAYALLNSPEMSAYLDKQEAEQAEQKKRLVAEQEAKQRKTGSPRAAFFVRQPSSAPTSAAEAADASHAGTRPPWDFTDTSPSW